MQKLHQRLPPELGIERQRRPGHVVPEQLKSTLKDLDRIFHVALLEGQFAQLSVDSRLIHSVRSQKTRRPVRFSSLPVTASEHEHVAESFELVSDTLTELGFEHYEISNFARPGQRCRHNEVYWTGRCYYAAGPGAARHVDGFRETNHRSLFTYLKRIQSGQSPVVESERLAPEDAARERLVFSLRRLEGIQKTTFAEETGFRVDQLMGNALATYVDQGFLDNSADHLRLTRAGLLVSDALWPKVLQPTRP